MDLEYSEEHKAFRAELREFLKGWPLQGKEAELPMEEQEALFRARGIEAGYVYRAFPTEYGGSGQPVDVIRDQIVREEYAEAEAPGDRPNQGPGMLCPTLLELGTEEQKRRFVPPTLRGEMRWCQGYSEPGSGSDLASVQCSARLEGDEWVINGQKIWTSNAVEAHYMFGLFRTEPEASKHAGISYLLIKMDQPGIEVRPLVSITGGFEFNEVFFTDARTPADHIVGKRGEGWQVSRSTLKHERNLIGDPKLMSNQFRDLVELAKRVQRRGRPAIEDPWVRQRLVEIEGFVRTSEKSNMRCASATAHGEELKAMLPMMMAKLYTTDTSQMLMGLAYDLLDGDGMLAPTAEDVASYKRNSSSTGWVEAYVFSLGPAIAGGATNIQLNIIGERALGLPRDIRPEALKEKPRA
jgi:alkylation response protein AidB-like acyl-CoA dehydrogenase